MSLSVCPPEGASYFKPSRFNQRTSLRVTMCWLEFISREPPEAARTSEHLYKSHLFVAGGRDTGLGFICSLQSVCPPAAFLLLPLALTVLVWRAGVIRLCFPEASFSQEALVHLQLLARLLPTIATLHLQLLDADLDVLDVIRGDPGSVDGRMGGGQKHKQQISKHRCWSLCSPLVLVSKEANIHLVVFPL